MTQLVQYHLFIWKFPRSVERSVKNQYKFLTRSGCRRELKLTKKSQIKPKNIIKYTNKDTAALESAGRADELPLPPLPPPLVLLALPPLPPLPSLPPLPHLRFNSFVWRNAFCGPSHWLSHCTGISPQWAVFGSAGGHQHFPLAYVVQQAGADVLPRSATRHKLLSVLLKAKNSNGKVSLSQKKKVRNMLLCWASSANLSKTTLLWLRCTLPAALAIDRRSRKKKWSEERQVVAKQPFVQRLAASFAASCSVAAKQRADALRLGVINTDRVICSTSANYRSSSTAIFSGRCAFAPSLDHNFQNQLFK